MKSFVAILLVVVSLLSFSGGVYLGYKSGYLEAKEEFEFNSIETQEQPLNYKNEYVDAYDSIYQRQKKY